MKDKTREMAGDVAVVAAAIAEGDPLTYTLAELRAVRAILASAPYGQTQRWAGEELLASLDMVLGEARSLESRRVLTLRQAEAFVVESRPVLTAACELLTAMRHYLTAARVCPACGATGAEGAHFTREHEECAKCRPTTPPEAS